MKKGPILPSKHTFLGQNRLKTTNWKRICRLITKRCFFLAQSLQCFLYLAQTFGKYKLQIYFAVHTYCLNCPKNVLVCWADSTTFSKLSFVKKKSLWKLANLKKGSKGISRFLSAIATKVISSVMAKVEMANNIN